MHALAAIQTLLNFPMKFIQMNFFSPISRSEENETKSPILSVSVRSLLCLICCPQLELQSWLSFFLIQAFTSQLSSSIYEESAITQWHYNCYSLGCAAFAKVLLLKSQQLITKKLPLTHRLSKQCELLGHHFYSTIVAYWCNYRPPLRIKRNKGPLMLLKACLCSFIPLIFAPRLFCFPTQSYLLL